MRILLDENLDWRLLAGHEVDSVAYIGWSGIKSGVLLQRAVEHRYEILLTLDGNMLHQQDIAAHRIAIIALRAASNRLADTAPLMPLVLEQLASVAPGTLVFIG